MTDQMLQLPTPFADVELGDAYRRLAEWLSSAPAHEREQITKSLIELQRLNTADDNYPDFSRDYQPDFSVTPEYRGELPDLQNGPAALIKGQRQHLQHVGISNFKLPIRFSTQAQEVLTLETSVTGSVSLDANKKGINMSRIMRSFYKHAERTFSFEVMDAVLDDYKTDLQSSDARLMMRFRYPMLCQSLRSGLQGYQYYDLALEVLEKSGRRVKIIHLDYVYSSTCPCSLELSEHARQTRNQLATPHSQRSVARLSGVIVPNMPCLWFEDMVALARQAVPTETQVMVKREDEQAFAELNGANPIFVEDAVRLFTKALAHESRIGDFQVAASHQESLHSHDAISIISSGPTFESQSIDPKFFASLYHVG